MARDPRGIEVLPAVSLGVDKTLALADCNKWYLVDASLASRTLNLPVAPPSGTVVRASKIDASQNVISVSLSGSPVVFLSNQNDVVLLQFTAGAWYIMSLSQAKPAGAFTEFSTADPKWGIIGDGSDETAKFVRLIAAVKACPAPKVKLKFHAGYFGILDVPSNPLLNFPGQSITVEGAGENATTILTLFQPTLNNAQWGVAIYDNSEVKNIGFFQPYAKPSFSNSVTRQFYGLGVASKCVGVLVLGSNSSVENVRADNFVSEVKLIGGVDPAYPTTLHDLALATPTPTTLVLNAEHYRPSDPGYYVGRIVQVSGTSPFTTTDVRGRSAYSRITGAANVAGKTVITYDTVAPTFPYGAVTYYYTIKGPLAQNNLLRNISGQYHDFGIAYSMQNMLGMHGLRLFNCINTQGQAEHHMYGQGDDALQRNGVIMGSDWEGDTPTISGVAWKIRNGLPQISGIRGSGGNGLFHLEGCEGGFITGASLKDAGVDLATGRSVSRRVLLGTLVDCLGVKVDDFDLALSSQYDTDGNVDRRPTCIAVSNNNLGGYAPGAKGVYSPAQPNRVPVGYSTGNEFRDGTFQVAGNVPVCSFFFSGASTENFDDQSGMVNVTQRGLGKDCTLDTTLTAGFTTNSTADFTTTAGSSLVVVNDPGLTLVHKPGVGDFVNIRTMVSVGGLIIQGACPVTRSISTTSFEIDAGEEARASVANGGVVPRYTTVSGSADVTVYLPQHGLSDGVNPTLTIGLAGTTALVGLVAHGMNTGDQWVLRTRSILGGISLPSVSYPIVKLSADAFSIIMPAPALFAQTTAVFQSRFWNGVPTDVGGITVDGQFLVTSGATVDQFVITESIPATGNDVEYENGGQVRFCYLGVGRTVNPTVQVTTTAGDETVGIKCVSHDQSVGAMVNFVVSVTAGGLTIQGLQQISKIVDVDNFEIEFSSPATSSVTLGGAVPTFTSGAASQSVLVHQTAHGLSAAQAWNVTTLTEFDGISLLGQYIVQTVPTVDTFTITSVLPAVAGTTVSQNSGLAQLTFTSASRATQGSFVNAQFVNGMDILDPVCVGKSSLDIFGVDFTSTAQNVSVRYDAELAPLALFTNAGINCKLLPYLKADTDFWERAASLGLSVDTTGQTDMSAVFVAVQDSYASATIRVQGPATYLVSATIPLKSDINWVLDGDVTMKRAASLLDAPMIGQTGSGLGISNAGWTGGNYDGNRQELAISLMVRDGGGIVTCTVADTSSLVVGQPYAISGASPDSFNTVAVSSVTKPIISKTSTTFTISIPGTAGTAAVPGTISDAYYILEFDDSTNTSSSIRLGGNITNFSRGHSAISPKGIDGLTLEDLHISDGGSNFIHCVYSLGCKNITVVNSSTSDHDGDGFKISGSSNGFTGVVFNNVQCARGHQGIHLPDFENALITNATMTDCLTGIDIAQEQTGCNSLMFAGVQLVRCGQYMPALTISGLTRTGATATATVASTAGLVTGKRYTMSGATETGYNVTNAPITITSATTFTYLVFGTPASPATGLPVVSAIAEPALDVHTPGQAFNFVGVQFVDCPYNEVRQVTQARIEGCSFRGTDILLSGITRSGAVATATLASTDLIEDGLYYVSGAAQPEYNGWHQITAGSTTFTFPVLGAPASPATTGTQLRIARMADYLLWQIDDVAVARVSFTDNFFKSVDNKAAVRQLMNNDETTVGAVYFDRSNNINSSSVSSTAWTAIIVTAARIDGYEIDQTVARAFSTSTYPIPTRDGTVGIQLGACQDVASDPALLAGIGSQWIGLASLRTMRWNHPGQSRALPAGYKGGASTFTLVANRLYIVPSMNHALIDGLITEIITPSGGAGKIWLGLVAGFNGRYPSVGGTLSGLIEQCGSFVATNSVAGIYPLTFAENLQSGQTWLALLADTACGVRQMDGTDFLGTIMGLSSTVAVDGTYKSYLYADLVAPTGIPAVIPALTAMTDTKAPGLTIRTV